MQICLSLCEKLDNKYLQRSPHLSWIQQPSNANGNDSIEFYGTFNFKSLDDYQEGKAFVEESNKKEIEERVKEIKEDIDRDLQVRQNLIEVTLLLDHCLITILPLDDEESCSIRTESSPQFA
jgi:hypothetical protein